jgi:hypothetical protein
MRDCNVFVFGEIPYLVYFLKEINYLVGWTYAKDFRHGKVMFMSCA